MVSVYHQPAADQNYHADTSEIGIETALKWWCTVAGACSGGPKVALISALHMP